MVCNEKSILIDSKVHKELKEASKKTGIKIKDLTETSIRFYLRHLSYKEVENDKSCSSE